MIRYNKWEEIRGNWVNGNRKDAREMFQKSKDKIGIIRAAIEWHWNHHINGNSGALTDLRELLAFIDKE